MVEQGDKKAVQVNPFTISPFIARFMKTILGRITSIISRKMKNNRLLFSQMRPEDEEYEYVKVWNPTVANLTLMVQIL